MSNDRWLGIAAFTLLSLTWGSSFILMDKALKDSARAILFDPRQVAAMRLSIAGLVLLPFSLPVVKKLSLSDWRWLGVVGLIGSGLPAFLFTASISHLDSSIAGILNALTPVFTWLIGVWFFGRKPSRSQLVGILVGLAGAIALISLQGFSGRTSLIACLMIVVATFSYGLSVNTVQSHLKHLKAMQIAAVSLFIVAIPCALYLFLFSGFQKVLIENPEGWRGFSFVLILSVMGTGMANTIYFWLTHQSGALMASSVTYVMPLVAVGWGLYFRENFTIYHGICGVVILLGVWLVGHVKRR